MMLSEFEKLTGLEVTTAEYEKIEAEYMESPDDKAKFCKMWLKKGGLQRLHNARLEEIERLKKTIEDLEHKLDEEQDWQISHKYGTHYQKTSYDHLTKRCSNGHQFESEAKAAEFISSQYGFDKDRIVFIHDVEVYETNRHGTTRLKERLTRFPYYAGCRANYARFDVRYCGGSMQWELVDGALKDYSTPPFLSDGEQ